MTNRMQASPFWGGAAALMTLALIAYWIVGAIRQESAQVQASIDKAASEQPFAKLGEALERQVQDAIARSEKALDEARQGSKDPNGKPDTIGDLMRTGQRLSSQLDEIGQQLFRLRSDEVQALGEQVNRELCGQMRIMDDPKACDRLRKLALPFLADEAGGITPIHFHVVANDHVNAFAHIGGHVYFTTAILDFVKSEAELQFVVGHEIAHVKLGHCTAQMTYAAQAGKLAGELGATVTQLAYRAIALGYSEDHEYAADAWSCAQAPDCRVAAMQFLARIREIYPDTASRTGKAPDERPMGSDWIREMENHFRTHPPTTSRIERLSARK
jgi:Zn-dependent protease with chaperone function